MKLNKDKTESKTKTGMELAFSKVLEKKGNHYVACQILGINPTNGKKVKDYPYRGFK